MDAFFLYVSVYQVDNLVGEEAVGLTHVQEQTFVALFGLTSGFLLVRSAALAFFAFGFSFAAAFGLFYFGSVFVVVQEAVEFHRYHALDEVFFAQPFPFAVDGGQEGFYFVFVYFYFFDVVYHLDELLFADGFSRGERAQGKLLVDDAFYLAHLAFLAQVDDGDGDTRLAGASGTSASVRVALGVVGQTVVDDVRQVVHVQSACGHVGSHQQLEVTLTELLHHQVALRLAQFSV